MFNGDERSYPSPSNEVTESDRPITSATPVETNPINENIENINGNSETNEIDIVDQVSSPDIPEELRIVGFGVSYNNPIAPHLVLTLLNPSSMMEQLLHVQLSSPGNIRVYDTTRANPIPINGSRQNLFEIDGFLEDPRPAEPESSEQDSSEASSVAADEENAENQESTAEATDDLEEFGDAEAYVLQVDAPREDFDLDAGDGLELEQPVAVVHPMMVLQHGDPAVNNTHQLYRERNEIDSSGDPTCCIFSLVLLMLLLMYLLYTF
ncbi:uncharacterized protein LOC120354494 [Nilaparvata lugens]|uniref:uncharacterized protein LOC120354494 n=1 Tax=Nilaparvata lugens TaxID=108931 RepID=UPI00193E1E4D|nr:uncharacterized protein LOC120354494 [Nilaparvata lugens]